MIKYQKNINICIRCCCCKLLLLSVVLLLLSVVLLLHKIDVASSSLGGTEVGKCAKDMHYFLCIFEISQTAVRAPAPRFCIFLFFYWSAVQKRIKRGSNSFRELKLVTCMIRIIKQITSLALSSERRLIGAWFWDTCCTDGHHWICRNQKPCAWRSQALSAKFPIPLGFHPNTCGAITHNLGSSVIASSLSTPETVFFLSGRRKISVFIICFNPFRLADAI